MGQAHIVGAGREQALIHPVVTEVAFQRNLMRSVKINGIIGTGLDARLTARAFGIIHDDNAISSFSDGFSRADFRTCRVVAMTASIYPKNEMQGVIDQTRPVFENANEFDAVRGTVFLLAGHFTGFTPPAGFMIDFEPVFIHFSIYLV